MGEEDSRLELWFGGNLKDLTCSHFSFALAKQSINSNPVSFGCFLVLWVLGIMLPLHSKAPLK